MLERATIALAALTFGPSIQTWSPDIVSVHLGLSAYHNVSRCLFSCRDLFLTSKPSAAFTVSSAHQLARCTGFAAEKFIFVAETEGCNKEEEDERPRYNNIICVFIYH